MIRIPLQRHFCAAAVSIWLLAGLCETNAQFIPTDINAKWSKVSAENLHQAAEKGDREAQYYLGMVEMSAAVTDFRRAYNQWRPLMATNRAANPRRISELVRTNWVSVPDSEIRRAAESGDRGAQRHISNLEAEKAADQGRHAFEWLEHAAAQSLSPAQFEVAVRYLGQTGWMIVPTNFAAGTKLLRSSAEAGYARAQYLLATMLISGETMPPNLSEGIAFLRKATDQKYVPAQFALGQQYSCGNGEPRSADETPVALFRESAEAGWAEAQFALAERYRLGLGVPKDYEQAIQWYLKASKNRPDERDSAGYRARVLLSLARQNGDSMQQSLSDPAFIQALRLYDGKNIGNSADTVGPPKDPP